jgi:hypothetical protein
MTRNSYFPIQEFIMLLYTGNSLWTGANINPCPIVHIADKDKRPLCGKSYKDGDLDIWEGNEKEVTCQKCLRQFGIVGNAVF